ncbi:MAG: CoA transferase [Gammaproteobacteria bacterium]|nr:CoA transferase [Gammaproteobacteria bacterium]
MKQDNKPLLDGIKVIELTTMVFGPAAGVVLSDYGADVIKIEPPVTGDLNRNWHKIVGLPISDMPYTFQMTNRNKKSVVLDLKLEESYEVLCKLVKNADVLITNYRLDAISRLKIDYETMKTVNPKIIYALATGYGEEGEERNKPGYDTVCYWSRSAFENHIFPYEGWLHNFPFGAGDHPSGMTLFASIMSGLYQRFQTGEGCKVTTSLLANGAWSNSVMLQAQLANAEFREKRPRDNAYNFISLNYKTKDDLLLKLTLVNTARDWLPFCKAIRRENFINDELFCTAENRIKNMHSLIKEISDAFLEEDMNYWLERLTAFDIPHSKIFTYEEAANDPQKIKNGIVVPLDHPEYGSIKTISSPFDVGGYEKRTPGPAPNLGEHTEEVLRSLGYTGDQLEKYLDF